ncbi:hypothetical protein B0I35DRAFT_473413 [Stachybotrys elegans]|uniref:Uncharacterized protein n=1 Tax=Stachybotrys elegans TaxID=80388 RepID=A0A8K0WXQ5_9HYPO|nr:hypothetical protein B0I35DRAFT_473413 [Stachybotrys elegans]
MPDSPEHYVHAEPRAIHNGSEYFSSLHIKNFNVDAFQQKSRPQRRAVITAAVRAAFCAAGEDPKVLKDAFKDSIVHCQTTQLFLTSSWSGWDGLAILRRQLESLDDSSDQHKAEYCLPAPFVVATYIMVCLRLVYANNADLATILLRKHFILEKMRTALRAHVKGNKKNWVIKGMPPGLQVHQLPPIMSLISRNADFRPTRSKVVRHSISREQVLQQTVNIRALVSDLTVDPAVVREGLESHFWGARVHYLTVLPPGDRSLIGLWAQHHWDELYRHIIDLGDRYHKTCSWEVTETIDISSLKTEDPIQDVVAYFTSANAWSKSHGQKSKLNAELTGLIEDLIVIRDS